MSDEAQPEHEDEGAGEGIDLDALAERYPEAANLVDLITADNQAEAEETAALLAERMKALRTPEDDRAQRQAAQERVKAAVAARDVVAYLSAATELAVLPEEASEEDPGDDELSQENEEMHQRVAEAVKNRSWADYLRAKGYREPGA